MINTKSLKEQVIASGVNSKNVNNVWTVQNEIGKRKA